MGKLMRIKIPIRSTMRSGSVDQPRHTNVLRPRGRSATFRICCCIELYGGNLRLPVLSTFTHSTLCENGGTVVKAFKTTQKPYQDGWCEVEFESKESQFPL
jgi:hypothetical protein